MAIRRFTGDKHDRGYVLVGKEHPSGMPVRETAVQNRVVAESTVVSGSGGHRRGTWDRKFREMIDCQQKMDYIAWQNVKLILLAKVSMGKHYEIKVEF